MSPSPITLTVRARRALARPVLRRALLAGLALATAATVASTVDASAAARDRWGRTRPVVVATHDLAAGQVVDAGAVEVRDLPDGVVVDESLAVPPVGAVVRHPILAGEPVVGARLAPDGLTGAAAMVGPGERAVAVPTAPATAPPVAVGDHVDVVAVLAPGLDADTDEPAFPLVERATVVDVTDAAVTVAVPQGDAARVAWVLGNGTVLLTLAGA